jgi:RNA repair pathway DNA polymerase beta family
MHLIVEMRFGSHLYGTATEQSDLDTKAVFIPSARDILLQRVRHTMVESADKPAHRKNVPGAAESEAYSLQRYLDLLAEGQTVALDMLFAPDPTMLRQPDPLWREIQANASRLVTRRASFFVRYCRQQANKYGIKGSRIASARQALALLSAAEARHGTAAKLAAIEPELTALVAATDHAGLVDVPAPGDRLIRHLEVCGRKMPFPGTIKNAREVVQRLVAQYGQRALQAERNEGVDWKALSHAVRVGCEALELLDTGRITLPLRDATEILAIKRGERPYHAVAAEIERLLTAVETAAADIDIAGRARPRIHRRSCRACLPRRGAGDGGR